MKTVYTEKRMTLYQENEQEAGHIDLTPVSPSLVRIDSVFTQPDFRGQGIAAKLMEALLPRLKEENKQVLLLCSTAQRYVAEHPEWDVVLAKGIHFEKN